ncbi:DUF6221 family protein [Micromonospora sp. WMMD1102]|uniref:DUF6221 family protein n=1 Tax=Micromonospora sp. WMMD1102 TaxID=3016105 RepID=UPI002414D0F8|nr:DUF6221 family protein [Micromonospora sp. WMMD1102]MDG4791993.1 DUF6221 family protein [Micromonospora sp. WMMD1102]
MGDTSEILSFIRARLDEDEQAAMRAAGTFGGDAVWRRNTLADPDYPADHVLVIFQRVIPAGLPGDDEAPLRVDELDHIAGHDPARVLAEVNAKRRILERHPGATATDECPGCSAWLDGTWRTPPGTLCPEQVDMALPYAGHADYRPEWRPT